MNKPQNRTFSRLFTFQLTSCFKCMQVFWIFNCFSQRKFQIFRYLWFKNKCICTNFAQNHFVTKNSKTWREIQISEILHSPLSPVGRGAVVLIDWRITAVHTFSILLSCLRSARDPMLKFTPAAQGNNWVGYFCTQSCWIRSAGVTQCFPSLRLLKI